MVEMEARVRLLLLPFFLMACDTEQTFFQDTTKDAGVAPGAIKGRVCSPDGRNWLPDAVIYTNLIDSDNRLYDTIIAYSDLDGYFQLEDLPGDTTYTVYVQYGDQTLETHEVFLEGGETAELEEPDCFDPLEVDVAVVTGDYDDFQLVLSNMGFANYEVIDGLDTDEITSFLLDAEAMAKFDIIFMNGGCLEEGILYDASAEALSDQVIQNLRDYVNNGGQIYASDWAYDYIEVVWPDAIDFVGNDDEPDAAQMGEYGVVTAAVADSAMAEWLGSNYVNIEYDLPVWPPIENVSSAVSVHLSGTVEYREGTSSYSLSSVPMLVSFTSGEGRVVGSTFRVAKNATTDMMLVLQYMMYNL